MCYTDAYYHMHTVAGFDHPLPTQLSSCVTAGQAVHLKHVPAVGTHCLPADPDILCGLKRNHHGLL